MDLKALANNFSEKMCKGKTFKYKLSNSKEFKLVCKNTNLPHLLGLNKLVDFDVIVKFNDKNNNEITAKNIYRDLVRENMTYEQISKSVHFNEMKDRLNYFNHVENLLFEKVIVDFDKSKLKKTQIKADILLYKKEGNKELILCLVNKGNNEYAPETFLVHSNDYYTKKQDHIPIDNIIVEGNRGKIIEEISYKTESIIEEIGQPTEEQILEVAQDID